MNQDRQSADALVELSADALVGVAGGAGILIDGNG